MRIGKLFFELLAEKTSIVYFGIVTGFRSKLTDQETIWFTGWHRKIDTNLPYSTIEGEFKIRQSMKEHNSNNLVTQMLQYFHSGTKCKMLHVHRSVSIFLLNGKFYCEVKIFKRSVNLITWKT